jgi:hypothetical protein
MPGPSQKNLTCAVRRRSRKFYVWSEPYAFLDQTCARMFFVVYGYGSGYGSLVETLLEPNAIVSVLQGFVE